MRDPLLEMQVLIQEDIGYRGLRTDPNDNLITACPDDFRAACQSLARAEQPSIAVVTGFFIPHGEPPCGETDGPLGAIFLARALVPLGYRVTLVTDPFCSRALDVGLAACGLSGKVPVLRLPRADEAWDSFVQGDWPNLLEGAGLTHLVALERVGPSHTAESLRAQRGHTKAVGHDFEAVVPPEHRDRCHTMRGLDITSVMSPAHRLFEAVRWLAPSVTTIGIGDGGNEIGMGKIPWDVVRRNIPGGDLVACRVPTDHLIVAGISNWGAYALAAGVRLLHEMAPAADLFDIEREREILRVMVEEGPLVDGVLGRPAVSVDGIGFESYAVTLRRLGEIV